MPNINESANKSRHSKLFYIATYLCRSKLSWWILLSMFIILLFEVHVFHSWSYSGIIEILANSSFVNSINSFVHHSESTTLSTIPTISLITTTTTAGPVVIEMKDRKPSYRLATKFGDMPYGASDHGQVKLLEELHLYEVCQRDPSTIVVDVGAGIGSMNKYISIDKKHFFLGDFGLYAAACGCTVYMFEIRSDMVALIRASIAENSFPDSRVHVFHNGVSDVPSDGVMYYSPGGGSTTNTEDPILVVSIRLDDVQWSSSSIFLLKVDVEGLEPKVLRSAKNLFAEKRIQHLIFKYTSWLTNEEPLKTLLPYVKNKLRAKFMYALYDTENVIYGPLLPKHMTALYDQQLKSQLETNVYAVFDKKATMSSIKSQRMKA
jgi:FkbM family methyltransferase